MKVKSNVFQILTFAILFTGCFSQFQRNRELKSQKVPAELGNKTWKLIEINWANLSDTSLTAQFNQKKGTNNCTLYFQFFDKGELIMKFKQYKFKGYFLIEGDNFNQLFCGFNSRFVWDINPECKINPSKLSYVLYGQMKFKIERQTLTLIKNNGDSFKLIATN